MKIVRGREKIKTLLLRTQGKSKLLTLLRQIKETRLLESEKELRVGSVISETAFMMLCQVGRSKTETVHRIEGNG